MFLPSRKAGIEFGIEIHTFFDIPVFVCEMNIMHLSAQTMQFGFRGHSSSWYSPVSRPRKTAILVYIRHEIFEELHQEDADHLKKNIAVNYHN